jgi:hypothetical protein
MNGANRKVRLNDCDVFHYFGDAKSKGKKNDHVFHNTCLLDIVQYSKRKCAIGLIIVWTDNCAAQYKCNHNFLKVARLASTIEGVKIKHQFAQKYHFKGVHDTSGKVPKAKIRALELERKKGERVANAKDCFLVMSCDENLVETLKAEKIGQH